MAPSQVDLVRWHQQSPSYASHRLKSTLRMHAS